MIKTRRALLFIVGFALALLLVDCAGQAATGRDRPAPSAQISTPTLTLTVTSTPTWGPSLAPLPTVNATQETWHATAVAIATSYEAADQIALEAKETQLAQFPPACEELNLYDSQLSPDGEWLAATCDYMDRLPLTVKSRHGRKWVLDFRDFVSRFTPDLSGGRFQPLAWSRDGHYLYFTTRLGYEGGGDECFPWYHGDYSLFGLNLSTGSWSTLIPPTDSFPAYEIEFSPDGRRYASTPSYAGTLNGVVIMDLQNGVPSRIATDGTVERLIWSPDSEHLAYAVATCDENGRVISSTAYAWDAATNQDQVLFEKEGMILRPEAWTDNSTLRIVGDETVILQSFQTSYDHTYTVYDYSLEQQKLLFSGSATPSP